MRPEGSRFGLFTTAVTGGGFPRRMFEEAPIALSVMWPLLILDALAIGLSFGQGAPLVQQCREVGAYGTGRLLASHGRPICPVEALRPGDTSPRYTTRCTFRLPRRPLLWVPSNRESGSRIRERSLRCRPNEIARPRYNRSVYVP